MIRFSPYAGVVALIVVAIAGCGGGDGGEETTAPAAAPLETPAALSKEELLAQGDAICAEVNAAVGSLASSEAGGQSSQAAELYGGMAERLKDLGAPSDDTVGYSEFSAAAEGLAQAESDVELAAERGEEEALATAEAEASSALSSFQAAASAYGFEQCSEGPSAPVAGASPETGSAEEPVEGGEDEVTPEVEEEVAPETGGAGSAEEGGAGGGAEAGGGTAGGGESSGGGEGSGGIGPG